MTHQPAQRWHFFGRRGLDAVAAYRHCGGDWPRRGADGTWEGSREHPQAHTGGWDGSALHSPYYVTPACGSGPRSPSA